MLSSPNRAESPPPSPRRPTCGLSGSTQPWLWQFRGLHPAALVEPLRQRQDPAHGFPSQSAAAGKRMAPAPVRMLRQNRGPSAYAPCWSANQNAREGEGRAAPAAPPSRVTPRGPLLHLEDGDVHLGI